MKTIYSQPQIYEEKWHKERYLKQHWYPAICDCIERYCGNKMVVDLGCGTGIYTKVIEHYTKNIVGIDESQPMLDYNPCKVKLICANAHNIPLFDNTVDTLLSVGLFEYVNRARVFYEAHRILKDKGIMIIVCPNKYSIARMPAKIFCKLTGRKYGCSEPSRNEMLELFKAYNFKLLEFKMDDGLIFPRIPIYFIIERFWSLFGHNPFSNIMLFVAEKR